ncbi:MAG TPA: hypothetical protein VKY26_05540, partial [Actinomycetota bacterium]|nr:hypothetical protein [Actinomycetota bacterium]
MTPATPRVVEVADNPLWFLGTLVHVKLDGDDTGGRFALIDLTAPRHASPPLHSHPQDETFTVLDGQLTVWILPHADAAREPDWVDHYACTCGPGSVAFAPAGTPHSFRVESDTAHLL